MKRQHALPAVWLLTDARNDATLETALARLPRGSGLVLRHYHLPPAERQRRCARLIRLAKARGHITILSGTAREARRWQTDGAYAAPHRLGPRTGGLRLATAHNLREMAEAATAGADAVLLSPVWPTRSHPGGTVLGPVRFRLLATRSPVPVIALGGMTALRARALGGVRWAAIDGLS